MSDIPFTPASFCQFISERKLMGARCQKCGAIYLPPRPLCIKCHDSAMEWVELKGSGKLAAFTIISVPPTEMVAQGYGKDKPYISGIVGLDEGPRISARIVGIEPDINKVKVGMPLKVDFIEVKRGEEKGTALAFRTV